MPWLLDGLVPQLARPHGMLGQLVASMLNRGNRTINLHVLGALDVAPGERVLELGFGGGVGLAILLAHEPSVTVSGIDVSGEMVQRCQRRFGGRVALVEGTVDDLPFAGAAFDKVFGVNVSYFWPDLPRALAEVHRVLAPGGACWASAPPKRSGASSSTPRATASGRRANTFRHSPKQASSRLPHAACPTRMACSSYKGAVARSEGPGAPARC